MTVWFLHVATPSSVYKSSCLLLVGGEGRGGSPPLDRHPPSQVHWYAPRQPSHLWVLMLFGLSRQLVLICIWCWDCLGAWGAIWAFCQLILMCVWCWGPFAGTDCYLSIFANWFWHPSTIEDCLWALSVIWAFLPIGSDNWLSLRIICVGEVFVWDSVPVTNGEGLWQICCLMCDWVFHLCDWHYCCLCKMRKSGSIH